MVNETLRRHFHVIKELVHAEGTDGAAFKIGENASGNERNEHD